MSDLAERIAEKLKWNGLIHGRLAVMSAKRVINEGIAELRHDTERLEAELDRVNRIGSEASLFTRNAKLRSENERLKAALETEDTK